MKECPECGKSNEESNGFCVNCGAKLKDTPLKCPKCNEKLEANTVFCSNCGYPVKNTGKNEIKKEDNEKQSRTLEIALGFFGGAFGLIGSAIVLFLGSAGPIYNIYSTDIILLGISSLIASVVGILSSMYLKKDEKYGAIALIIAAIWLFASITLYGSVGAIFLAIAGISTLVRK